MPKQDGNDEQEQQLGGQQIRASGRAASCRAGKEETSTFVGDGSGSLPMKRLKFGAPKAYT